VFRTGFRFHRHALGIGLGTLLLAGCGRSPATSPLPAQTTSGVAYPFVGKAYKLLYSFQGGTGDGAQPSANLINVGASLYGTTADGGEAGTNFHRGCGTVFQVTQSGTERVLHTFGETGDGCEPLGDLANVGGNLYGTTAGGGPNANGTVFVLTQSGVETVLYSFKGYPTDGSSPTAGLIYVHGSLYGTTEGGGNGNNSECGDGCGTVFKISTDGVEDVLYSFNSGMDGQQPLAALTYVSGAFYGTTFHGGVYSSGSGPRCGTVFRVTADGKERVIYRFKGGTDGQEPMSDLVPLHGKLYGTTKLGGTSGSGCDIHGCGTIFETSTSGTERVLYRFKGGKDGQQPFGGLTVFNGALYGTTYYGGATGDGTVFEVSTSGGERVLYSFKGSNGANPMAGMLALGDTFFGTTLNGGQSHCTYSSGCGTVFRIAP
jgi:uncharacterized repeat protein (TIGR03803 family)